MGGVGVLGETARGLHHKLQYSTACGTLVLSGSAQGVDNDEADTRKAGDAVHECVAVGEVGHEHNGSAREVYAQAVFDRLTVAAFALEPRLYLLCVYGLSPGTAIEDNDEGWFAPAIGNASHGSVRPLA